MQVFDDRIYEIVEKGLQGKGLTEQETLELYRVPETSKEAAYIRWAGQDLSLRATDGIAEIHAQIGLNATTCPKDCLFCSFARVNDVRKGVYEVPKEEVLEYAKAYVEEGANLILMLTTASYKFEKLEDMVGSVREVIDIVKEQGGVVAGVGVVVDRTNGQIDFGVKLKSVISMEVISYEADECPLCKQNLPLVKPGSRKIC